MNIPIMELWYQNGNILKWLFYLELTDKWSVAGGAKVFVAFDDFGSGHNSILPDIDTKCERFHYTDAAL